MQTSKYQVIEIIDANTLIVDYGMLDGATYGQKLRIFTKGEPVKNLNGVEIGTLDIIKGIVEITTPYDSFSLCKKVANVASFSLNPLSQLLKESAFTGQLEVDKNDMSYRKIATPTPIKLGDPVTVLPSNY